jgi:hypothetical protein
MQQNDDRAGDATHAGDAKQTVKSASRSGTKMQKKTWRLRSIDNKGTLEFHPVFETSTETGDVETRYIAFSFIDDKGRPKEMTFNWLDVYMFVYFTCNEELRRNLAARYEREVSYIPYDVTIPITQEDIRAGKVKRRVELPVDELQMAIARNEAYKMLLRTKDPRAFRPGGRR